MTARIAVSRRTQYDLKKAKERAHILEGLKKATDIVDELIATIRACKGGMAEAKAAIMEQFGFDDPQADAIVKLQSSRKTRYCGSSQDSMKEQTLTHYPSNEKTPLDDRR